MILLCARDLVEMVEDGYLYGVIDLIGEMNDLLGRWSGDVVGPGRGTAVDRAWSIGEVWDVR